MNVSFLPQVLEKEYNAINAQFAKIRDDYKKYNDEILPEDKAFARRILTFIINVIEYVLYKYEEIDREKYREFLGTFHYTFCYGPNGDDSNYLDFDETLDGEPISEFSWELADDEYTLTKDKLKELRKKYRKVLELFQA